MSIYKVIKTFVISTVEISMYVYTEIFNVYWLYHGVSRCLFSIFPQRCFPVKCKCKAIFTCQKNYIGCLSPSHFPGGSSECSLNELKRKCPDLELSYLEKRQFWLRNFKIISGHIFITMYQCATFDFRQDEGSQHSKRTI